MAKSKPKAPVIDEETLYAEEPDLLPRPIEYELAYRWLKNQDRRARDKLIACYQKLAVSCAQRAARNGLPFEDLLQEANIGMLHALDRFDPSLGNGFGTFARYHIINRLQIYALYNIGPLRIFNTAATKTLLAKFNTHKKRIEAETGRVLDDEGRDEICRILGIDREQLRRFEMAISGTVPLDTGAGNSPDDHTRPVELPAGPIEDGGDSPIVTNLARAEVSAALKAALAGLPERERKIVIARYLKEPAQTLDALSRKLGISRERVRQIEIRALKTLAETMRGHGIDRIGDLFPITDAE